MAEEQVFILKQLLITTKVILFVMKLLMVGVFFYQVLQLLESQILLMLEQMIMVEHSIGVINLVTQIKSMYLMVHL
jgi:hypothetical protein